MDGEENDINKMIATLRGELYDKVSLSSHHDLIGYRNSEFKLHYSDEN